MSGLSDYRIVAAAVGGYAVLAREGFTVAQGFQTRGGAEEWIAANDPGYLARKRLFDEARELGT